MVIIKESDMCFGEYEDKNVFQIEKSIQYRDKLQRVGVKSCEFLLLKNEMLFFIEAKKTCPNHLEASSTEEKRKKYEEYVNDIVQKMKDSLMLYTNIVLHRYDQVGISNELLKTDWCKRKITFLLVVKNAQKEWLEPFGDVFRKKLCNEMKIWKIRSFLVLNEDDARKMKLIK